MITLNGVTYPENMMWINEFDTPAIPQQIVETLGGQTIPQILEGITPSRTIILEAADDGDRTFGALTRTQVLALKAIEATGASVPFEYHGQLMNVCIIAGGVQFSPIFPHPDAEASDLYAGTLTLTEL